MFKKFIKATCLLAGVMFVAACTDYAEDIRDINDRIGQLEGKTMSSLTEQKEGLEAALKKLEGDLGGQISDNIAKLQGQIKDLESDLEKLEAKQEKDIQDLNAAIAKKADQSALDALSADLDKEIENLQKQITKNATDISTLTGLISGLTSRMNSAEAALKTLNETTIPGIQKQIADLDRLIKEDKQDLADYKAATNATIALIWEAIDEVEEGLSTLDEKVEKHYKDLKEDLEKVNGRVDGVEERLAEVNKKIEALEKDLEALETKVDENYAELMAKFDNYVLQSVFDEYKENMNTRLEDLQAELEGQINALEESMNQIKTELEGKIDGLDTKIDGVKKDLEKTIQTMKDEIWHHFEKIEEVLQATAQLAVQNKAAIAKLQTNMTNALNDINEIKKDGGLIDTKVAAAIDALKAEFKSEMTAIKSDIADLQAKLNALQINVEDLLARMQSIVYVPDYNDGKITINYAKIGEGIVEGQQTIRYKVTPANCAEPLATLAKAQTAEELVLSYLIEEVAIRTRAEEAVPTFTVVDAKAEDNGFLTLTVETRNLGDEFYAGSKSYSVALLVTDGNNDRTTEYANCVPGEFEEIVPKILIKPATEILDITDKDTYEEFEINQTIQYVLAGIENGKPILENHWVAFDYADDTYTAEELYKKFGYTVNVVPSKPVYTYTPSDKYNSVIVNHEVDTLNHVTAYLDYKDYKNVPQAELVGKVEKVKYAYTVAGVEVYTIGQVEIVKEKAATIEFGTKEEPILIYWNFLLDAQSDADHLADPNKFYTERFLKLDLTDQTLPNGMEWDDITGNTKDPDFKYKRSVNGAKAPEGLVTTFCPKSFLHPYPYFHFAGFEWDATYDVETTFEYDTFEVDIIIHVKTIDRVREDFKVIFDEVNWDYTRDMEIAEGEISDSLKAVYDKFAELNAEKNPYVLYDYEAEADMKVEDFLNTVFAHEDETAYSVNEETLMVGTHVTDLRYKTRMVIAEDSQTVSYRYTYKSHYFENPLKYQKDVIFWFFDAEKEFVHLEKTINFDLPMYNYSLVPSRAHMANGAYCAHALGRYMDADGEVISIDSKQVHSFDIENLDLLQVFYVTLEDEKGNILKDFVTIDEIWNEGLVSEFRFVSDPKDENIVFVDDEKNPDFIHIINYGGRDKHVYVVGDLYLVDSDFENGGNKVKLTTRFDTIDAYKNFEVKKYNPIDDFIGGTAEIEVIDVKNYTIDVLKLFKLNDYRNGRTTYELIDAEKGWVVGDGENGYAEGRDVRDVYDLKINYSLVNKELPTELRIAHGDFDENTGKLTFVNDGNLILFEDITVPVTLTIEHKWCDWDWTENKSEDSATVVLTFLKNVPDSE